MKFISDATKIQLRRIGNTTMCRMLVFQMITEMDFCCLKYIFTEQLRLANKCKSEARYRIVPLTLKQ